MRTTDNKLIVERRASQLWLTFNRPEKANALTAELLERAAGAIAEAGGDPGVRAVLVTGAGDRFFCAGVDVTGSAGPLRTRRFRMR
jgi:enoyl-CoA hydratase/carnithine racemase